MDQDTLFGNDGDVRLSLAWENVHKRLSVDVPKQWIDRFIRPLAPLSMHEDSVEMLAPGRFVHDWVRERYLSTIQRYLSDELGREVCVDLVIGAKEKESISPVQASISLNLAAEEPHFKPNDRFTFESYVVGQTNRLAVAGAKAVAAEPGTKYNPLFIYGASGLGKTHLLHSIAREILKKNPRYPLVYISAQQFAEDFVNALQAGRIEQFRRSQRNVGVWLVDDIQFVAGKDKTQEEVFHTFNYLHSLGKQIVLTSDRPPRDLYLMDERLRSRFEAGLVADVQMPDTETRCAILLSKAAQEGVRLDLNVAMYLAENVPGNIRVLEGALTKLSVQASIEEMSLTLDLATHMVEQYYRAGSLAKPSFTLIVDAVARHYNIAKDEILGTSRKAPIVHARHVAVYVTREITMDSWKHIGTLFGDRDHTSMMHGYQKISEMMAADRDLHVTVKALIRNLYPEA